MSNLLTRFALPLLVFATVLSTALFLSWWFFLPRFAGVPLHGKLVRGSALVHFYADLRERAQNLEDVRKQLVLPGQDPLSQFLHKFRRFDASFFSLSSTLTHVTEGAVPNQPDVMRLASLQYDVSQKTLTVTGDVQHVGPRSMTVLAQFIEMLRNLPFVEAVEHQRFTREEDTKGAFHSPFTLLLRLRSPPVSL